MKGIRKGEPWGRAASGPVDTEVAGGDAELAAVAAAQPGARVAFRPTPSSDLARAIGLHDAGLAALEVPIDGLRLDHRPEIAVNAVVLGTPPDRMRWWDRSLRVRVTVDDRERFGGRAVAVVIASGQYLRGLDLVPRGHPGDGRAEIQVYELGRSERRAMRRRLPQGAHVPHPRIQELTGRRVEVRIHGHPAPLEADGKPWGQVRGLSVEVRPAAIWVLI